MSNDEQPLSKMVADGDRDYRNYVLAELRLALMRAKLYQNEIVSVGIALKAGAISPTVAMEWLHDANALGFLEPTKPVANGGGGDVESGCSTTTDEPSA